MDSRIPSWEMTEEDEELDFVSCRNCYWFNWRDPGTCAAYPEGIPPDLAFTRVKHNVPFEGDNGIQFRPWSDHLDEG